MDIVINGLRVLWYAILVMLLFGGTIFLHELGHYLSARWLGLKIKAFAIGMGPAFFQRTVNGIAYKLCILPIGGYVALPQMDITGSALEDPESGTLPAVAPWKRIVVAIAGPMMNVLFAIILAFVVYWVGKPYDPVRTECVLAHVEVDSVCHEAGLRVGDRIVHANRDKVRTWGDLYIVQSLYDQVDLTVERDGETLQFPGIRTSTNVLGFSELEGIGPGSEVVVEETIAEGAAAEAGVLKDDVIYAMNGKRVLHQNHFFGMVQKNQGEELALTVLRGELREEQHLQMSPRLHQTEVKEGENHSIWLIGVRMTDSKVLVHPKPSEQLRFFSGMIFRTFQAFTRKDEIKGAGASIGGAPMIIWSFWKNVQLPIGSALWWCGLLNINLAIINLMPIIVLDGGHIMVALFEIITRRKPHPGVITVMANIAIAFLLTAMVFLSFRDLFTLRKINRFEQSLNVEAVDSPDPVPVPVEAP